MLDLKAIFASEETLDAWVKELFRNLALSKVLRYYEREVALLGDIPNKPSFHNSLSTKSTLVFAMDILGYRPGKGSYEDDFTNMALACLFQDASHTCGKGTAAENIKNALAELRMLSKTIDIMRTQYSEVQRLILSTEDYHAHEPLYPDEDFLRQANSAIMAIPNKAIRAKLLYGGYVELSVPNRKPPSLDAYIGGWSVFVNNLPTTLRQRYPDFKTNYETLKADLIEEETRVNKIVDDEAVSTLREIVEDTHVDVQWLCSDGFTNSFESVAYICERMITEEDVLFAFRPDKATPKAAKTDTGKIVEFTIGKKKLTMGFKPEVRLSRKFINEMYFD